MGTARTRVAFDSETWLIRPGLLCPPPVCFTFHVEGGAEATLLLADDGLDHLEALLADEDVVLAGQNVAFDLAVAAHARPKILRLIFDAYDCGRVLDVKIRDKLLLLALGRMQDDGDGKPTRFGLDDIVKRRFDADLSESKKGADSWRLRYSELDGVPRANWPVEAVQYAKDDATWVLRIAEDQDKDDAEWQAIHGGDSVLGGADGLEERRQTRAAWDLHLASCWGVRVDGEAVADLRAKLGATVEAANDKLRDAKLLKGKATRHRDGTSTVEWARDLAAIRGKLVAAYDGQGLRAPMTAPSTKFPAGQVQTDHDALVQSGDPDLLLLAESAGDAKLLDTYVPALEEGLTAPICPGWNSLVSTGRTSCYKPNMQNPPRKGGVRECFAPRPGFLYLSADYNTIELRAWAQVCLDLLGRSSMAEAIREGLDLHLAMGAEIVSADRGFECSYEEIREAHTSREPWAKDARQLAKAANFGFPGGLGPRTFVQYARATYGVQLDEDEASRLRETWRGRWSESVDYFNYINSIGGRGDTFAVTQVRSGRVRGGATFTSAANGFFQGLAADGAKAAMAEIQRLSYLDSSSALHGCRLVMFLHDEFILEVPDDRETAHAAALELVAVMVQEMARWIPDVPVAATPALMRRWYKDAEPVWEPPNDPHGRLVPWEPEENK